MRKESNDILLGCHRTVGARRDEPFADIGNVVSRVPVVVAETHQVENIVPR